MPQFTVDEDLAALVEKLAKPKPFENLTFNNALRRVLEGLAVSTNDQDFDLDKFLAESMALRKNEPKKASSPDARKWAESIPELKCENGLTSWKAICDFLHISTGGDSARRKLRNWVKEHKTDWPEVPGIEGD
jgi:hypothetical protein